MIAIFMKNNLNFSGKFADCWVMKILCPLNAVMRIILKRLCSLYTLIIRILTCFSTK